MTDTKKIKAGDLIPGRTIYRPHGRLYRRVNQVYLDDKLDGGKRLVRYTSQDGRPGLCSLDHFLDWCNKP